LVVEADEMKHHIGKFKIATELLRDDWRQCHVIFEKIVPIGISHDAYGKTTEIVAHSFLFIEIDEGVPIPEYEIVISRQGPPEAGWFNVEAKRL
jgi:hypothetical protein